MPVLRPPKSKPSQHPSGNWTKGRPNARLSSAVFLAKSHGHRRLGMALSHDQSPCAVRERCISAHGGGHCRCMHLVPRTPRLRTANETLRLAWRGPDLCVGLKGRSLDVACPHVVGTAYPPQTINTFLRGPCRQRGRSVHAPDRGWRGCPGSLSLLLYLQARQRSQRDRLGAGATNGLQPAPGNPVADASSFLRDPSFAGLLGGGPATAAAAPIVHRIDRSIDPPSPLFVIPVMVIVVAATVLAGFAPACPRRSRAGFRVVRLSRRPSCRPDAYAACRALSKTYVTPSGGIEALHDVDADFAAGQITALVGASGSGKSTLLRALTSPAADGWRCRSCSRRSRRASSPPREGATCVSQKAADNFVPHLTMRERPRGGGARRVRPRRSARLDADPTLRWRAARAAFALALARGTALVITDEPTAELDRDSAGPLLAAIRDSAAPASRSSSLHTMTMSSRSPTRDQARPREGAVEDGACGPPDAGRA